MSFSLSLFITFIEKNKKKKKIKILISKKVLKNNNYWKTMRAVRRNNFNTTISVNGHIGGKHIANHFKQIECNSLPHVDDNDISNCHIVSKYDCYQLRTL